MYIHSRGEVRGKAGKRRAGKRRERSSIKITLESLPYFNPLWIGFDRIGLEASRANRSLCHPSLAR